MQKETLPKNKTAVLVIDVQKGLFEADPGPRDALPVIKRINSVLENARAAGVPVFFIQHDGTEDEGVEPNSEGWKPHPALELHRQDKVVRKATCDAFYKTALERELQQLGVNTLVLTGYATEFCVDATLRHAVSKDYRTVVVSDAHTTDDSPEASAEVITRHHNWAWENCTCAYPIRVIPAGEVVFG